MKSKFNKLKQFKDMISLDIVKQPKDIKAMKTRIIIRTILVEFLFSVLAFSIQGAQIAIRHNLSVLAIILISLHFSERVLSSIYNTYSDVQNDNFQQTYSGKITSIIMDITCMSSSKVLETNSSGLQSMMSPAEIIEKSTNYINSVWNFWWTMPIAISKIITLIIMIGITIKMEFNSYHNANFMIFFLILCIVIYFIFGKERISVMKKYKLQKHENDVKKAILLSEIQTIEFSSKEDFLYHANRLRNHLIESQKLLKNERLKLNSTFIKRSIVSSIFMISILIYKTLTAETLSVDIILGIIAISTVYSKILDNISNILSCIENTANYIIEMQEIYPAICNIHNVYSLEKQKDNQRHSKSNKRTNNFLLHVNKFSFAYGENQNWQLINPNSFDILVGEIVLVQGETGIGKSTAFKVLNGDVRMPQSPIFIDDYMGYMITLTYHTDRAMANNYILNEIILSDDYSVIQKEKLFEILEGLQLKQVFLKLSLRNIHDGESEEDLILKVMKSMTYKQFSSGQQQRIALAKMLYTLNSKTEAILLDEAFNRLNDDIARSCAKFIFEYTQRDRKRLVMVVTHQISIIKPFCSKEISFELRDDGASIMHLNPI